MKGPHVFLNQKETHYVVFSLCSTDLPRKAYQTAQFVRVKCKREQCLYPPPLKKHLYRHNRYCIMYMGAFEYQMTPLRGELGSLRQIKSKFSKTKYSL